MFLSTRVLRVRVPSTSTPALGHLHFCGYVPDWASDFLVWAFTYFSRSIYKLYRVCTNIGWAGENICRAHQFQNHMPDGHVSQMLNVKPCHTLPSLINVTVLLVFSVMFPPGRVLITDGTTIYHLYATPSCITVEFWFTQADADFLKFHTRK